MAASKRSYAFSIHKEKAPDSAPPKKKDPEKHNWDRRMQRQKEEECCRRLRRKVCAMGEGISAGQ